MILQTLSLQVCRSKVQELDGCYLRNIYIKRPDVLAFTFTSQAQPSQTCSHLSDSSDHSSRILPLRWGALVSLKFMQVVNTWQWTQSGWQLVSLLPDRCGLLANSWRSEQRRLEHTHTHPHSHEKSGQFRRDLWGNQQTSGGSWRMVKVVQLDRNWGNCSSYKTLQQTKLSEDESFCWRNSCLY